MSFLSLNHRSTTTTLRRHKALTIDDGKRVLDQANREGCFGRRRFVFSKDGPRFIVVKGIDNFNFNKDSLLRYKEKGQSKEIQDLHRYTFQETFDGHKLGSLIGELDGTPGELLIDSVIISYKGKHLAILFDKKLWIPIENYDTFLRFVCAIPADAVFSWLKKMYPTHTILDDAKETIHKIYSLFAVMHDFTFEEGMDRNNLAPSMRDAFRKEVMMEDEKLINLAACLCSALNHLFDFDFQIMKRKLYNRIQNVTNFIKQTSLRLGPPETASTAPAGLAAF